MKAIFIDAENKSVSEIEIGKDWRLIAPKIGNGCQLFCCAIVLPNQDTIYADDEAYIHNEFKGFFEINNSGLIAGNGLIMGSNDEGESVDVKSSIEEIKKSVKFAHNVYIRC